MIMDVNKYINNRAFVHQWYEKNKESIKIQKAISTLACSTGVPCICLAFWLGEVTDWPEEILNSIEKLRGFYGYTDVIGKPASYPGK